MYSHEAANLFTDHIGAPRNSHFNSDAEKMICAEAESEIKRGALKGQKNQWSKAVEIALERMKQWYDTGLEYHFDTFYDFVASHRVSCAWCVFLKLYHPQSFNESDPDRPAFLGGPERKVQ